jgi:hypothetical protein
MALIALKRLADGEDINIEENDITVLTTISGGASVEYEDPQSNLRRVVEVSNNIASIALMSDSLFSTTVGGVVIYLHMDKVVTIYEDNSLAVVLYDRAGSEKERFATDVTMAAIQTAMYEKKGYGVYAVDSYDTNKIILDTAEGDLTSSFTSGKVLSVVTSTSTNNNIYNVSSSAYVTSKTEITVSETVSDVADTTGLVVLKA